MPATLSDLPIEIWLDMMGHLSFSDFIRLQQVNRDFNRFFVKHKWALYDALPNSDKINCTKDKSLTFIPKTLETYLSYEYIVDINTLLNKGHTFSDETIDSLHRYLDFAVLARGQVLSDTILRKYWMIIPIGILLDHQSLPIDVLTELAELHALTNMEWKTISQKQKLTLEFIMKYEEHINWRRLSMNKESLTPQILERYLGELIVHEITKHGIHSDILTCFIDKIDRISWINISYHSKLDDAFIRRYLHYLDPDGLLISQELSCDTIELILNAHSYNGIPYNLWQHVATHQSLTADFIKRHHSYFNRTVLLRNRKIKRAVLQQFDELH
jgi:hypothetical protein